jgi:flagellar basal-body rod protein FlgF
MNSGLYAACSGLVSRMQALDTIASNVANSASAGYQGEKDSFGTMLNHVRGHDNLSALNQAANTYSLVGASRLDDNQGMISRTDSNLDVAIQGAGYLKVQTSTGIAYTRNGKLQTNAASQLTTSSGDLVLGDSGPISLGPGAVTISKDGTIATAGAICGKLSVVKFAAGDALSHRGGSLYTAPVGAQEQPATDATIEQGALEGSNVDSVSGIVQLITAERAAESMRHAVSMLDGDMNKTAVQDLARVS